MELRLGRAGIPAAISLVSLVLLALPGAPTRAAERPFPQGVAARAEVRRATLWTRVTSEQQVRFEVARDRGFDRILRSGRAFAHAIDNYTIDPLVMPLQPATRYFYRFRAGGAVSPMGTFRTLPSDDRPAPLFLAYSGDSDVLWTDHPDPDAKPFEVLRRVAEEHPDLFLYIGDTIYSDSETGARPALSVSAKWRKYRRNRIGATRQVLRSVSTWSEWDDHEVINDFDGAVLQASDPDLFAAGKRAFDDYWPHREDRYFYKVDVGSEIDLIFLDERSYRTQSPDETDSPCRDDAGALDLVPTMPDNYRAEIFQEPVDPACFAHMYDATRTMLGAEQLAWLKDTLQGSTATWKLIVNEVPITQIYALPYDRWEGYSAEREDLLGFIGDNAITNVVFLTTDLHVNVGAHVYVDIDADPSDPVAYEAIAGPIQTCTLKCEVDELLGEGRIESLRAFLRSRGLIDDDCIQFHQYGYATVEIPRDADTLKIRWRSNERRRGGGGRPVDDCPVSVTLRAEEA